MWYYSEGGQQRGPVDEDAFADLVRKGTVTPGTLVWRGGMATWQPYGAVAGKGASPEARVVMCTYCGKLFPEEETVDFSGSRVCAVCKPLFVQRYKENAEATGRLGMRYAGFWIRAGAHILDGIFTGILTQVVVLPLSLIGGGVISASHSAGETAVSMLFLQAFIMLFSMAVQFAYSVIPLVKWGATPGKMICGLKVVRSDGSPLTFGRATGRFFGEMLSGIICSIGYLMAAFDNKEHKALHDSLCDTRVIFKNN